MLQSDSISMLLQSDSQPAGLPCYSFIVGQQIHIVIVLQLNSSFQCHSMSAMLKWNSLTVRHMLLQSGTNVRVVDHDTQQINSKVIKFL